MRLTLTFERFPIGGPLVHIGYYETRDQEMIASGSAGVDGNSLDDLRSWITRALAMWWYQREAVDEQLSIYDILDHPF